LGIGLLIGFISKRVAYGLLLGIGIALFMMYYLRPRDEE
jgi:MFS superfamily sulfate permease-like transporter